MDKPGLLARLWSGFDTIMIAVAFAGGIFFLDSLYEMVSDMQALDERWMEQDNTQTADIIAAIEEVRTGQGKILGRLNGFSADLVYQVGLRDGQALCAPQGGATE